MTRIVSTKSAHSKINYQLKKYSLRHMLKNKTILDTLWYKISPLSESAVGSNSIIISNQLINLCTVNSRLPGMIIGWTISDKRNRKTSY